MLSQRQTGQGETANAYSFDDHATAQDLNHAPNRDTAPAPTVDQKVPGITRDQPIGGNFANQGAIPVPVAPQWLLPNGMIDSCPAFAPNLYRNWSRVVTLWRPAQIGATATTLIAKIVSALPTNSRIEILNYLANTERCPETQTGADVMKTLNARYAKTASERARSWFSAFAEFKRDSGGGGF